MGTNYYHRTNICECCGRYDEQHVGKSSGGWTFSFQGTEQIRSYRDWIAVLEAGGEIRDEYGDVVTLEEFKRIVDVKRREPHHHAREYPKGSWSDADGHSFSEQEFS